MIRTLDQNIIEAARDGHGGYKVLPATIYRPAFGDCSNGGVSSKGTSIYVICPDGFMTAAEGKPLFAVMRLGDYTHLTEVAVVGGEVQVVRHDGVVGPMAGGNLADTSDSRWRSITHSALPIHDRWETQEQYAALSV